MCTALGVQPVPSVRCWPHLVRVRVRVRVRPRVRVRVRVRVRSRMRLLPRQSVCSLGSGARPSSERSPFSSRRSSRRLARPG